MVGIGPVGIVHVARAGLLGPGRVIAIDPFDARVALAAELGASDTVVAGAADPIALEFVGDVTGGRGVDVVNDATGHPASFVPSLALLRDGGTLVAVGAFVDLGTVPVNPATILGRNLSIIGVAGEDARVYDSMLAMLAEHHERVPFRRAVTHSFPLAQVDTAMQTALGADTAMKVNLTPPTDVGRLSR